jgi:hypothetical protein
MNLQLTQQRIMLYSGGSLARGIPVKISSASTVPATVALATSNSDAVIGVTQAMSYNGVVPVALAGSQGEMLINGTIATGDRINVSGILAASGDTIVAKALEDGTSGDIIAVELVMEQNLSPVVFSTFDPDSDYFEGGLNTDPGGYLIFTAGDAGATRQAQSITFTEETTFNEAMLILASNNVDRTAQAIVKLFALDETTVGSEVARSTMQMIGYNPQDLPNNKNCSPHKFLFPRTTLPAGTYLLCLESYVVAGNNQGPIVGENLDLVCRSSVPGEGYTGGHLYNMSNDNTIDNSMWDYETAEYDLWLVLRYNP